MNPPRRSKVRRRLGYAAAFVMVVVMAFAGWLWRQLHASLARLDGEEALRGLSAPAVIERDSLGIPTIHAASRLDAARPTGFVHAQDRYFQMDLLRRAGAGELAELLGPPLIDTDRALRLHRFRTVAGEVLRRMSAADRALLEAYAEGANAGLEALGARPPEYLLLRSQPAPWRPEDSILVADAMCFSLEDSTGIIESGRNTARQMLGPAAFAFYFMEGTGWDAALDDSRVETPRIPSPAEFDVRTLTNRVASAATGTNPVAFGAATGAQRQGEDRLERLMSGSNGWAVDGRVSGAQGAIVANDMHLDLRVPNIWYRLSLRWPSGDPAEPTNFVSGASLPGTPMVVVGSNGHVAWGFTYSCLDNSDLIELETAPDDPNRYRTPDGWKLIERIAEPIRVRGAPPAEFVVEQTIWGPVLPETNSPRRALRWAPQLPDAINFHLFEFEQVRDAAAAIRIAPHCGTPLLNLVVGDRAGNIGWTVCGRVPRRIGFDGRFPVSWADGTRRWDGWIEPGEYPVVANPPSGRVWTANNRMTADPKYTRLGLNSADLGARAHQIRDDLFALTNATPRDLLAIQTDDRAVFLARWQGLLVDTLNRSTNGAFASWRQPVIDWGGRAATNSVGYRLVRAFRNKVRWLLLGPIYQSAGITEGMLSFAFPQSEGPAWALLQSRPAHLLPRPFGDYHELLDSALESVRADFERQKLHPARATWGERNRSQIQHPMSMAVPFLSRWLDMPPTELPGDNYMPRIQTPDFGASERMVVSPGREAEGIFEMPGGQSGHFLSPYYRAGHADWEQGRPSPFLPGATVHSLRLVPDGGTQPNR